MSERKHDHDDEHKPVKSDPSQPQTAESDPPKDPPEGPGGDDRG
jgi:hypothetical protein